MKFKKLNGIAYNICDMVRCSPFQFDYFQKIDIPEVGEWIIDLKNNSSVDQKRKPINIPFTDKLHKWFLLELKNANGSAKDIKEAQLMLKFNFKKRKPIECSCRIFANRRLYSYKCKFRLF